MSKIHEQKKILVTGGNGMLAYPFKDKPNVILLNREICNLDSYEQTKHAFQSFKPDIVVHLAAKVGGIKGNMNNQNAFFQENMNINMNVLNAAHNTDVDMVVSALSTCIFPENPPNGFPYKESDLHNGIPHQSNYGYAYAKRMLEVQSRIYREQYNRKYICVIPNNLFGENDNFDLENGHVLPAIIRKIYEAKQANIAPTFWGNGTQLRQFTYSEDAYKSIMKVIERTYEIYEANKLNAEDIYENYNLVNIGNNEEIEIRKAIEIICEYFNYDFNLVKWDMTKPSGIYRKPSTNVNFMNLFVPYDEQYSWYHEFKTAIYKTCKWFEENYPNIRG